MREQFDGLGFFRFTPAEVGMGGARGRYTRERERERGRERERDRDRKKKNRQKRERRKMGDERGQNLEV